MTTSNALEPRDRGRCGRGGREQGGVVDEEERMKKQHNERATRRKRVREANVDLSAGVKMICEFLQI